MCAALGDVGDVAFRGVGAIDHEIAGARHRHRQPYRLFVTLATADNELAVSAPMTCMRRGRSTSRDPQASLPDRFAAAIPPRVRDEEASRPGPGPITRRKPG
jgi:hypothetical protein